MIRREDVPAPPFTRRTKVSAVTVPHSNATQLGTDEIMIYTHGQLAKVGKKIFPVCAIVFETRDSSRRPEPVAFRTERQGPTGQFHSQKGLRAALRVVVAALELKIWSSEEFEDVTIVVNNEQVFEGFTQETAVCNGKGLLAGTFKYKLTNRDLWSRALDLVNEQTDHGSEIRLSLITSKRNKKAGDVARAIDPNDHVSETYQACGDVGSTFMAALGPDG